MAPLIPILIVGGGAVYLFAKGVNKKRVSGWERCAVVKITQAEADRRIGEIMAWVGRWRDRPNDSALDCMTDFCRMLWPNCTWPPPGDMDRTIVGTDGASSKWSTLVAAMGDKTVGQASGEGLFRFGSMSAADASGMSQAVGPGVKGVTG